jgi:hypothetical protein
MAARQSVARHKPNEGTNSIMRRSFAIIDAVVGGVAVGTVTAGWAPDYSVAASIAAGIVTFWAIRQHGKAVKAAVVVDNSQGASETVPPAPKRPIIAADAQHVGIPSAGLWHAVKWVLAVGILATSMGKSGRVGAGPIALASVLLRRRRAKMKGG